MSAVERRLHTLRAAVIDLKSQTTEHPAEADVQRVTEALHPYLYDGTFAANLQRMRGMFTEEQADTSADRKREEHYLEVELVLLHFLNTTEETP